MTLKRDHLSCFLWFYGLCLGIQLLGAYFTGLSVGSWYPTLEKSPLNPPGYVFGVAWTILYFLMAVAATRVHAQLRTFHARPLRWWLVQLLLGLIWCILFFGGQSVAAGLVVICATTLAVIVTLVLFWRVDDLAGLLMLPLLLWLTLATHLNLYIYLHA